jgi:hypothetical protein
MLWYNKGTNPTSLLGNKMNNQIFNNRQLNRYYKLTWIEEGEEFVERWSLAGMIDDGFDLALCSLAAGLMDGDKIPTELDNPVAPVFIEATGDYYEASEEASVRECHHLGWQDAIAEDGPGYVW